MVQLIADLIGRAADRYGEKPAIRHKVGDAWEDVSFAAVGDIASEITRGLIDLGIERGDRVALLGLDEPIGWRVTDDARLEVTLPERLPVTAAHTLVLTGRPRSTAAATD